MSAPARVLMTADAVGGVWTYALDLAAGLARQGVATTLVTLGPRPAADQRQQAQATPGLQLIETDLKLDWTAETLGEIEAAASVLRSIAHASGADLIHLNSPALAIGGGFSAPVLGVCHSCLATWWSAVKDGPMPDDFRWRSQALWRGLLACDALAAPTEAFARATALAYELPTPFVIRNGRDAGWATTPVPRETAVITAGRLWDEGKNVAVLDRAAALTRVPVQAAGWLEDATGGRRGFANLDLLGRLSAPALRRRLARTRVYATSALYEPFGLGVLEAAQAGCALVLSDIPTFRELWDQAAIFVAPDDAEGFARAFERLAADPLRAEAIGEAARLRAEAFSTQAMVAGVLDLYRQLGASHAHRRLQRPARGARA